MATINDIDIMQDDVIEGEVVDASDSSDLEMCDPWEELYTSFQLHDSSGEILRRLLKLDKQVGGAILPSLFRDEIVNHIGELDVFTSSLIWQ